MAGLITPDIFELRQFCDEHKLFLIEDVAHALGASYKNYMAGSLGNIGCFSFYPTKIITCGEGGMLTTNEDEVADIARSLQNRGKDIHLSGEVYNIPGRNIRMTEMSALLGRVQLNHLEDFIEKRRALASIYARELSDLEDLSILFPQLIESSSFWKFPIILNQFIDRDSIMQSLINEGVEVDKSYYPPLHLQPVFSTLYGTYKGMLPKTENILNRHIFLPCHPRMSDKDAIFVTHTLKSAIKNYKKRAKS
jgi:perosamine synthetase